MNRRNFLKFLGAASVGATVAYSFPDVIVPKNIEINGLASAINAGYTFSGYFDGINIITKNEIYPKLIEDFWFQESPFLTRLKMKISDDSEYGFGYVQENGIWVHEVHKTPLLETIEDPEPIFFINSKELNWQSKGL